MKITILILNFLLSISFSSAQYNKTANDFVPEYNNYFTFGTNYGYPSNGAWSSEELANISAGNNTLSIPGAGCNSMRGKLTESFLEQWGYTIRVNAYQHTAERGMFDLTVFLEGPADIHKDNNFYCSLGQSKMFVNMYEPIWDNEANGTPYNENNYLAAYVYKTVTTYGDRVKFWEIWNEPDYSSADIGWKDITYADNWWIRNPKPEELDNLYAPIFHYIRALRVCYEVIKSIDENDFVCLGGIGYSSFLDAILRNTDNPSDGSINNNYPLKGGAYFDCVSYHNYPMYSLRKWENGAWTYLRHFDKAVEALTNSKASHTNVLESYGYDGTTYPGKEFIITETNVSSIPIDEYIGSPEAQRNYLMKIIVAAQKSGIKSLHTFSLYDGKTAAETSTPYHSMGFYTCLNNVQPYNQQEKISAIGCRSLMKALKNTRFDQAKTDELSLPANVDGAAFKDDYGAFVYVLWARTTQDKNENTTAQYTFPASFNVNSYTRYEWDYTVNDESSTQSSSTLELGGIPSIFTLNDDALSVENIVQADIQVYPNPVNNILYIDSKGKSRPSTILVQTIEGKQLLKLKPDSYPYPINLVGYKPGVYILKLINNEKTGEKRFLKL